MISVGPWSFAATDEGKLVIQKADPIDPTVRYPIATFHRDDTTGQVSVEMAGDVALGTLATPPPDPTPPWHASVPVPAMSAVLNGGGRTAQAVTIPLPALPGAAAPTVRYISYRVVRGGRVDAGDVLGWWVRRRLASGADVIAAQGSFNATGTPSTPPITQTGTNSRTYSTTEDEVLTFEYWWNNCNDGWLQLIIDLYDVSLASDPSQRPVPPPAKVTVLCNLHLNGDLVPTGNVPGKWQP